MVFLYERTNINIDITNTVTEVKAVFTVFEIPLKSISLFRELAQPKAKDIFVNGTIKVRRNCSIIVMKNSIELFDTMAVEIVPPIVKRAKIIGINAPIILQSTFMYSVALATNPPQILNTVTEMHRLEQREKAIFTLLSDTDELSELKTEISIISTRIDAKFLITPSMPAVKYDTVNSKKDFSLILPLISSVKSPFSVPFGKKSFTFSGRVSLNPDSSSFSEDKILSSTSDANMGVVKMNIAIKTVNILVFFIYVSSPSVKLKRLSISGKEITSISARPKKVILSAKEFSPASLQISAVI